MRVIGLGRYDVVYIYMSCVLRCSVLRLALSAVGPGSNRWRALALLCLCDPLLQLLDTDVIWSVPLDCAVMFKV